jgi:hypothetical protein
MRSPWWPETDSMNTTSLALSRRGVLTAAAGAGVAAVASHAARSRDRTTPASAPEPPAPPGPRGYHVTDHVKRYYRTTQV